MLTRNPIFFPLILVAFLALITFWINQTVEQQGPKIDGSNRHDPDYYMNNFVTTQTDATGRLSHVLAATNMTHYPDDDSTTLQRPRFTQFSLNKPFTQIESTKGYVSSNGTQIKLVDNVKVLRQAYQDKGEMEVFTDQLTIYPDEDLAKTDRPVLIKQAPKTVIHAVGMVYDKKNQTMQLLSHVKAHYEKPKTNIPQPKAAASPKKPSKKVSTPAKKRPNKIIRRNKK